MKKKAEERGYCLVSQQIREEIAAGNIAVQASSLERDETGFFKDKGLEGRVQPASFEPVIGDEVFVLDVEDQSVFTPGKETVYRALLQLPRRQRQKENIEGGFELKRGFTYAIPLEEKITLKDGERIRSSPKSSTGRLFPVTRMLTDYSEYFDEINSQSAPLDKALQLWLLVQPTCFNLIVHPGISLTQLRFFRGLNASLSQQELLEESQKNPFLYTRRGEELVPSDVVITDDGLQINLDLTGEYTEGIVALRARSNPTPIDLARTKYYNAEDFFEPVKNKGGKVRLKCGERYLIASKGVLCIPPHLNAELRRHYGAGLRAAWDEAGFVDPGFEGDLVFEVTPTEAGGMMLSSDSERPASALEFFRTNKLPDKLYGTGIGSHYQKQLGSKVSKHFQLFDFAHAAKTHKKLDREVLVQDTNVLLGFREGNQGFEPINPHTLNALLEQIQQKGFFQSRYDCEADESVLQFIPYVLLFGDNEIFVYERASKIKDYGDKRLFGKHSIGLGGHVIRADGPDFIKNCLEREVFKEEIKVRGEYSPPKLVGTLVANDTPVDKVHFGLIYATHINGEISGNESSMTPLGMKSFEELQKDNSRFETWSKKLIPYLPMLYKQ
jgi:predicted NUDIX family phosphoesterase/deoxycytidine triphosphate deaminase